MVEQIKISKLGSRQTQSGNEAHIWPSAIQAKIMDSNIKIMMHFFCCSV